MKKNQVVPAGKDIAVIPNITDIFSEYCIRGIGSWNEIQYIGKNNIGYLLRIARGSEKTLNMEIKKLKKKQAFLRDKTGKDFEKLSEDFETPENMQVGKREGNWSGDLQPIDKESEDRKAGSTQYNICDWCLHASGSHRYSYCLSGNCSLLNEWAESVDGRIFHKDTTYFSHPVKFNTECLLMKLSSNQFGRIVDDIEKAINHHKVEREKIREAIRQLIQLRNNSDGDKPWLVDNRPHDYMNVGDELVVYIGCWDGKEKIVEGDWVDAIGIFGYRHHDGCMSYQAVTPIHSNLSYLEGRGGGADMGRPEALHRWEFDYLHKLTQGFSGWAQNQLDSMLKNANEDTIFLRIWFSNISEDLEGFSSSIFFDQMKNPNFVKPTKKFSEKPISIKTAKDAGNVLQMLNPDHFETVKEIKGWANMQLRCIHPDTLSEASEETLKYAERQTQAVCEARDFLLNALKCK